MALVMRMLVAIAALALAVGFLSMSNAVGNEVLKGTVEETQDEEGFHSLESMLHWAIGHSDSQKLSEAAMTSSPEELARRQQNVKEILEMTRMPSDAELMKIAIGDLSNDSLSVEDRRRALNELIELVEPIDNANDLDKLGGLIALVKELERPEAELRTAAAWAIGKASQNNPVVQAQAMSYEVLPRLMTMVRESLPEEALKAFYAMAALVRNHAPGQDTFYAEGGAALLKDLLSNSDTDSRLARKSLLLVGDLANELSEQGKDYIDLLKSVIRLLGDASLDTREQALLVLQSLTKVDSILKQLRKSCNVEEALERLRVQLEADKETSEYNEDVRALRDEVAKSIS